MVSKKFTPQDGWQDESSPPKAFTGLDWGKGVVDFAGPQSDLTETRVVTVRQARHALEVCERVIESSDAGRPIDVVSRFSAPPPVEDVAPWETD